jgi:hypothetical protein
LRLQRGRASTQGVDPGRGGETASLDEELAEGDPRGGSPVRQSEPRQVAAHRRIEGELAGLDELHDGERRDGLAQRAEDEWRLGRHGAAGRIGLADAGEMNDLGAVDDAEGGAGDARRANARREVAINSSVVGSGRTRRRGRWDEQGENGRERGCE